MHSKNIICSLTVYVDLCRYKLHLWIILYDSLMMIMLIFLKLKYQYNILYIGVYVIKNYFKFCDEHMSINYVYVQIKIVNKHITLYMLHLQQLLYKFNYIYTYICKNAVLAIIINSCQYIIIIIY